MLLVGAKTTCKVAVSPALMVGVEVEAVILKSTMFAGGCAGLVTTVMPLLFAVAVPEIWICWAVVVIAGVTSTQRVARPPAASEKKRKGIAALGGGLRLPEP